MGGLNVIAIIPARGGSKRVLGKNLKLLAGKPLIAYTIEEAKKARLINKVFVSTDSMEIAEVSKSYGAEVIKRPEELAQDTTPSIDVLKHALGYLDKGGLYADIVVLLQPTSPFRDSKDIDRALKKLIESNADSVVSVVKENNPFLTTNLEDEKTIFPFERDTEKIMLKGRDFYRVNGAVYAIKRDVILKNKNYVLGKYNLAIIMSEEHSLDIDELSDFAVAECLLREKPFEIEEVPIKKGRVFVIAEAGVNHNGSLEIAKKLVDAASEAGADAVKFQNFKAEDFVTEEAPMAGYQEKNLGKRQSQRDMLKKLELSEKDFQELRDYCKTKNIIFLSTPHSGEKSVDFLESLDISAYKLGSGDLTNLPLIEYVAQKKKPIILSTGMANLEEVKEAIDVIRKYHEQFVVLHCTTNYPCELKDVNLRAMLSLEKELNCLVGYSDHTIGIEVSIAAANLGACIVEKHFTLDKNMEGPDHKASLEPDELKELVRAVKENKQVTISELILGSPVKKPTKEELEIAKVARKSLVAASDIKKGVQISRELLEIKRPGTGTPPNELHSVIGRKAKIPLKKEHLIKKQDLSRRIAYITGTRADYGLMSSVLREINENPDLDLVLVATGMHLMPEFGNTIAEIEKDGFNCFKVDAVYEKDSKESMARFLGKSLLGFVDVFKQIKPDIVLVLGDRAEMLSASSAAAYLGIPIAHVHGGELTSTIDEPARHAITKLANIHFVATEKSAERLKKMGEQQWRIYNTGAPALDRIYKKDFKSKDVLLSKYGIDSAKKLIIVLQHPVTAEAGEAQEQIKTTLEAVSELDAQVIAIYPNADAGGRSMIEAIDRFKAKNIKIYKSLPYEDYLGLMNIADVLVGNSSSGIIEAPSFKLPVVNIGNRQEGRERSLNVIDVGYNKGEIIGAVKKALSKEFGESLKSCISPYGAGNTAEKIAKILSEIKIDKEFLQKRSAY